MVGAVFSGDKTALRRAWDMETIGTDGQDGRIDVHQDGEMDCLTGEQTDWRTDGLTEGRTERQTESREMHRFD